jgi:hypothetical protein
MQPINFPFRVSEAPIANMQHLEHHFSERACMAQ